MSRDALDLREIVRRMADDTCERLAADAVALWLRSGDGRELMLAHAAGFRQPATAALLARRPSTRLGDWLVARRLPAVVTLTSRNGAGERAWLAAEAIHSLLAVSLPGEEASLGVLAAFRRRRPFAPSHLARAGVIAATTAPSVHAAQRLEQERARAERAETLLGITSALTAASDLEAAIEEVARRTARAVGAARWRLSLSSTAPTEIERSPGALVLPVSGTERILGTFTLAGPPPVGWTPAAVELATAVAAQVGRVADAAGRSGHAAAPDLTPAQQEIVQREALRALADLASGAAHHLNNLLTVVVGRVQLLLRSTDDQRVLRTLAIVEKAAKDGAEVVHQLQQFSLVRPLLRPRPVRIDHVLVEILAEAHRRWPRTPLTKVDVDSRLGAVPAVAGDAGALRDALGHIVANAMEAMPTGGRLVIETRASEASVSIVITDTGVGMSTAVRLRAPEPFFTTKGVKATGLGLSVAYGIVRSHGGEIAIRSAAGAGTTVIVTLPRVARRSGATS